MLDTEFNNIQIDNWKIRIHRNFLKCNIKDFLPLSSKTTPQQNKFVEVPSSQYTRVLKGNVCINGTNHPLYLKQYCCRSVPDLLKCIFRPGPANRSFNASIMLQENGLDAPVAVGLFEQRTGPFLIDNLLLTEEVQNALKKTEQRLKNKRKPTKKMKKYLRTNKKYLRLNTGQWLAVFDRKFCR